MKRKTMRLFGHRTSIKLEREFWSYLSGAAQPNRAMPALIEHIIGPERVPNVASHLRVWCLKHACGCRLAR